MSLDTTNWAKFPVSVDGIQFVSLIDPNGSFYPQIATMPQEVLELFHADMVHSVIGDPNKMTRKELQDELDTVNLGATQAILALA
jgi:hypothetical protein